MLMGVVCVFRFDVFQVRDRVNRGPAGVGLEALFGLTHTPR